MKFDLVKAKRVFHKIDPLFPSLALLSQYLNAEISISLPLKTASMPSLFSPATELTRRCGSPILAVPLA